MARYAKLRDRVQPEHVVETQQKRQQTRLTEFVEKLATSATSATSTNLSAPRQLTISDMRDYAERTYRGSGNVDLVTIASEQPLSDRLTEPDRDRGYGCDGVPPDLYSR